MAAGCRLEEEVVGRGLIGAPLLLHAPGGWGCICGVHSAEHPLLISVLMSWITYGGGVSAG